VTTDDLGVIGVCAAGDCGTVVVCVSYIAPGDLGVDGVVVAVLVVHGVIAAFGVAGVVFAVFGVVGVMVALGVVLAVLGVDGVIEALGVDGVVLVDDGLLTTCTVSRTLPFTTAALLGANLTAPCIGDTCCIGALVILAVIRLVILGIGSLSTSVLSVTIVSGIPALASTTLCTGCTNCAGLLTLPVLALCNSSHDGADFAPASTTLLPCICVISGAKNIKHNVFRGTHLQQTIL
jgi:hypothetical protein